MKLVGLALILFLAGIQSQDPEAQQKVNDLAEIAKRCEDEKKPNAEALAKVDQGQEVEDKSVKEYLVCLLDKAHLIDEEGNLVDDNIEDALIRLGMAPDAVPLLETQCDKEGKDKEETALKFSVCIMRALKTIEDFLMEELQGPKETDSKKK